MPCKPKASVRMPGPSAALKAKHRMSYADCYAAAPAKEEKSELVTGDREFKQVDGAVKIRWL